MKTKNQLKYYCLIIGLILVLPMNGQEVLEVRGKVTSAEDGLPLPGVNVAIKGTSDGTVTDFDGDFVLTTNPDATLVFSYLGFETSEIDLNGRTNIQVSLSADNEQLSEVVVVGYGSQQRRNVTGAVASISAEKIEDRPTSNAMQALAGQVAGVQIQQTQGAPGFSPTVQIRGVNSISAGSSPLYVIDGIPVENGDLNMINPNDIESIEILKDASSAAIYGSRGGNGVILITTKGGKSGETNFNVTYERGLQEVAKKVDMMNSQQFIQYYIDAHNNAWISEGGSANDPNEIRPDQYRIPPNFLNSPDSFETTDWQDVIFDTAPIDNVQLGISGGNDQTKFRFSGGYLLQDGVLESSDYERMNARINLTHEVTDKLDFGLNLAVSKSVNHEYGTEGKSDVVSLALQNDPIFPIFNENGNYGGLRDPESEWFQYNQYGLQLWHPYAITREQHNEEKESNVIGRAYLSYEVIEGLELRSSLSSTLTNNRLDYFWDGDKKFGWSAQSPPTGSSSTFLRDNWIFENTANYEKDFVNHSFNGLLGYSLQKETFEENYLTSGGFPNDKVRTLNAGNVISGGSFESEWSLISYIARLNYAYKDKYLLTATVRRDGSSRFGADTKWGNFPSASLGWIISEEDFMSSFNNNNYLKLRASYGVTGNNLIPNYGSISLLGQTRYVFGDQTVQGLYNSSIPNPNLGWEKTNQFDLGVELRLFNGRIDFIADYYRTTTEDLLLDVPVPSITGYTNRLTNIGKIQNSGMEFSLTTRNLVGQFKWTSNANLSFNRNKVLQLGPNNSPIYTEAWGTLKSEVGEPLSNFYGYIFDGVYNTEEEINSSPHYPTTTPGDPIVRDVNGDGVINSDDRTIIGNNQPDFTFGFRNDFSYKNFELSFLIQGSQGGEILNAQTRFSGHYSANRNAYSKIANYWRSPENPGDGQHFKPSTNYDGLQTAFSDYWVEDGSFVRIKFATVSYNLPADANNRFFFKSSKIYFNVENLYTFSDYVGYDPEASINAEGLARGVDYGTYPLVRTYSLGINLNF